jgi:hypothetical protein
MIAVFYAFIAGGAVLLALDIAGRLTVRSRVGLWRAIGVIAAAGPGIAPILSIVTNRLTYEGLTFPAVAVAYLAAFLLFVAGVSGRAGDTSLLLRRVGYVGLLVLGAIPSWVLLVLTPLIFIAGAGLVRQSSEGARSA